MPHVYEADHQESGGSIRVRDHENRLLASDPDDGEMYYVDEESNTPTPSKSTPSSGLPPTPSPHTPHLGSPPTNDKTTPSIGLGCDGKCKHDEKDHHVAPELMEGEMPALMRDRKRAKRATRASDDNKEKKVIGDEASRIGWVHQVRGSNTIQSLIWIG